MDATHKEELNIRRVSFISRYLYQRYSNNLNGVVSIAQLVEVADSAVLGGVAEVVSSNPTAGHNCCIVVLRPR